MLFHAQAGPSSGAFWPGMGVIFHVPEPEPSALTCHSFPLNIFNQNPKGKVVLSCQLQLLDLTRKERGDYSEFPGSQIRTFFSRLTGLPVAPGPEFHAV